MRPARAADFRAGRARDKRRRAASGGLLLPRQRFAQQRQAIIAEIHVSGVEEDGRRAETAALHHLVGVGLELILDRLLADPLEERLLVRADASADLREHGILRNVLVLAPI